MQFISSIADLITIVAGAIAISGVLWAVLTAAKLEVTPRVRAGFSPLLSLSFMSIGSNPIRNIELIAGTLTPEGFSMSGGDIAHRGELHHGEILTIDLYDPESVTFSDQPRDFQYRFGAPSGFGCYVSVRRQSSYFPWKWKTRTYVWDFVTRYSDGAPKVYEGKQEVSFRESIADPRLNPNDERYDPPAMATPTVASDESYDQLTADAKSGINIVGFVGTWQQGELFRNFTNALNAFAAKHPGIQVLVIHPDTAPALSKRFDTDALPAYIAIQDGEEVESRTGLLSCSDLESYFHKSIEVASKKREGR